MFFGSRCLAENLLAIEKSLHVYKLWVESSTMTESLRIYLALRNDIISCAPQPGASASASELCSRYKGSRTPRREACRQVQDERKRQSVHFRGYLIAPPISDEL